MSVRSYTRNVKQGMRGRVDLQLVNMYPIVQVQVRLGALVAGQIDGTELRDILAVGFSVPRVGDYNLTVSATDSTGCEGVTTMARLLTVKP